METKGDRARLQVWLPVDLLERLTLAAREGDRPLSREVVRRLEASFGSGPSFEISQREVRLKDATAAVMRQRDRAEAELRRLQGVEMTDGTKRVPPETPEPRAEVVERLQQQVPGVATASAAFPSVPQDLARQVTPRPRRSG